MPTVACDLSLILVNYHSGQPLRRFFKSLGEYPLGLDHEILLVDNSPSDGTAAWIAAEHPDVRILPMRKNVGYAGAVNAAIAEAHGQFFLVVNPDVEMCEGGVEKALAYLQENPEVGMVGARLLNADGTVQRSARRFYTLTTILLRRTPLGKWFPRHPELRRHLMLEDALDRPGPVDWIMGAWMLVRRQAVEKVGPMDDRFFLYFEDVDWCYRMWEGGYEVHYYPEVAFPHFHERSSVRIGKPLLHHLRSFLSFYDKWGALIYVAKRLRTVWRTASAILSDLIVLNLAFLAAFTIRRLLDPIFPHALFDIEHYIPLLLFSNGISLVVLPALGRYGESGSQGNVHRWLGALKATFLVSLIVMAAAYLSHSMTFSRAVLLLFVPCYLLGLGIFSWLRGRILGGGQDGGGMVRLLLLEQEDAFPVLQEPSDSSASRWVVAGSLAGGEGSAGRTRWLGEWDEIEQIVDRYRIDEIWVDGRHSMLPERVVRLKELAMGGIRVRIHHPWSEHEGGEVAISGSILHAPFATGEMAWVKTLMDRPVGSLLCLFSLPLFVLCSIIGFPASLLTLRNSWRMGINRERIPWRQLVCKRSGRPLPTLFQLLVLLQIPAGKLGLTGPCSLPVEFEKEIPPAHMLRFTVKPGISGPWQKLPSDAHLFRLLESEKRYLDSWSLTLDLDLFLDFLFRLPAGKDHRQQWTLSDRESS